MPCKPSRMSMAKTGMRKTLASQKHQQAISHLQAVAAVAVATLTLLLLMKRLSVRLRPSARRKNVKLVLHNAKKSKTLLKLNALRIAWLNRNTSKLLKIRLKTVPRQKQKLCNFTKPVSSATMNISTAWLISRRSFGTLDSIPMRLLARLKVMTMPKMLKNSRRLRQSMSSR